MTTSTRQRTFRTIILLFVVSAIIFPLVSTPSTVNGTVQRYEDSTEVRRIADQLQCPVCHGQSVAESNSQVAQSMKETIRDLLDQGHSEKQILVFFEERYGPGVLRNPPRTGIYALVWWTPGVGILVGAGIVYKLLRRRQSPRAATKPPKELANPAIDSYLDRLRRDVELGE